MSLVTPKAGSGENIDGNINWGPNEEHPVFAENWKQLEDRYRA